MTPNPCHNCKRRYIACHSDCEAYHEWLAVHAAEKDKEYKEKSRRLDADSFMVDQKKRVRSDSTRKYLKRR